MCYKNIVAINHNPFCSLFRSQQRASTSIFERKRIRNSPGQRPEACLILCLGCFKSISLIIVRSQGPRWAKLGGPDNPWINLGYRCVSRRPAPFPFKIDFLPAEELILVFLPPRRPENDISAPFCCRSSSAHVSGRLQGPFWDQFSPQKWSFVDLFSGPVGHICWVIFHSMLATRVL